MEVERLEQSHTLTTGAENNDYDSEDERGNNVTSSHPVFIIHTYNLP